MLPTSFSNCSPLNSSPNTLISTPAFANSAFILSTTVTIVSTSVPFTENPSPSICWQSFPDMVLETISICRWVCCALAFSASCCIFPIWESPARWGASTMVCCTPCVLAAAFSACAACSSWAFAEAVPLVSTLFALVISGKLLFSTLIFISFAPLKAAGKEDYGIRQTR